jgi:hypothetical protein
MMDIFSIFAEVYEQKIGMAAESIPGTIAFFGDNCSNKIHFGGREHSMYKASTGSYFAVGGQY